jgi:membrane protease YdiL (CAAX protease family)
VGGIMGETDSAMPAVAQTYRSSWMPKAPERPFWVLARMFGWILIGFVGQVILGFFIGFSAALGHLPAAPPSAIVIASACGIQGAFVWGALHQAKVTGWRGDIADGLGFFRPQRWKLLAVYCVLTISLGALAWVVRLNIPRVSFHVAPIEAEFSSGGIPIRIILAVITILVAPVAEELFFRGWLWTALRLFWKPPTVIIVTGAIWLGIHALDDWHLAIGLFPLAIILGIARHFCRSVVATMGLHMCNNAFMVAELFAWYR